MKKSGAKVLSMIISGVLLMSSGIAMAQNYDPSSDLTYDEQLSQRGYQVNTGRYGSGYNSGSFEQFTRYSSDPANVLRGSSVEPLGNGRVLVRASGRPGGFAYVTVEPQNRRTKLTEVSSGQYEAVLNFVTSPMLDSSTFRIDFNYRGREAVEVVSLVRTSRYGVEPGQRGRSYDNGYYEEYGVQYGVVEQIFQVQKDVSNRDSDVGGAILGGVVGGILGNQVGGGTGKDVATVIGVLGGAHVGKEIAQSNDRRLVMVWRMNVRLDSGAVRSFDYANPPNYQIGTQVRIKGNEVQVMRR